MYAYLSKLMNTLSIPVRMLIIAAVVAGLHLLVILVRRISNKWMSSQVSAKLSKSRTISSLTTSALVFFVYFSALGLILSEFGVSLKAYLASASILGLAIGFGSQGLVQDVVNGLTVVFSGLFDVGDMVEISGQTGIVSTFGMRFTVIQNALGAEVSIPNRTITNVVRYPRGYIRGLADITLSEDPQLAKQAEEKVKTIVRAIFEQLSGTFVYPPSIEGRIKTSSGKEFLRVKFRLWPGRGSPIETVFKQEVYYALKALDSNYQDWMVTVNYEVERKSVSV
ncbi:MAG: mechanosensitive ion channel domain-containing protein [Desulfatiglandaceae bacterium]